MPRNTLLIATTAMAVWITTAAAVAPPSKVTLAYKAHANQVMRYSSDASLKLAGGGNTADLSQKEVEAVTITGVAASGDITREARTESSDATINGQKVPDTDSGNTVTTTVLSSDGTLVSLKETGGSSDSSKTEARAYVATTPVFPATPIGVGDKWSHDYKGNPDVGTRSGHADFELQAIEAKGGVDCARIHMIFAETDSGGVSSSGTYWVELTSGDSVYDDYEINNLKFGDEADAPVASGKVHEERLSGSPMSTAAPTAGGKTEPKKDKTIDEFVKDYTKLPGLFTLYTKTDSGRQTVYMEVRESQLDQLMLLQATAATGTSGGIVEGDPLADMPFRLSRGAPDRIVLVSPNIAFRANPNHPIVRALRRSFADAILDSFRVEARQPDRKSLLINVSDMFRGDIAEVGRHLPGYTVDRENTYYSSVKTFPTNMVFETTYNYVSGRPSESPILADARSVPLKVMYNVFAIPDDGYRPRVADSRIGYFTTDFQDFDNDRNADTKVHYILRWNMTKADPTLAMSPPSKPIVFWMDNAIPTEYRDYVREGLLMWNKAFEQVGIKDAIIVKQMPDNADWDTADMRYNTIRWVASPDAGYAVALFRANPLTGEILNANITVDANFVRYIKLERAERVDPATYFRDATPPPVTPGNAMRCEFGKGMLEQGWFGWNAMEMLGGAAAITDKEYLHEYLREVVGHEMGHIMGLRHNFIASAYHTPGQLANEDVIDQQGISSSIMEYTPFNVFALKHKGVNFYTPTIGPYDMWAMRYGYTPVPASDARGERYVLNQIASQCNQPGHQYESDEVADQWDPDVTRFDLATDPLDYWTKMLDVSRTMMLNLGNRLPAQGDVFSEFSRGFYSLLGTFARSASNTSRFIGGLNINRNHRGDPGEKPPLVPVPAASQRRALSMLDRYVFAENALTFPKSYYTKFADPPFPNFLANSFPVMGTLSSLQQAALNRMFSTGVMDRIANNEFKTADDPHRFTLAEMFQNVSANVWTELDDGHNVNALRRNLQRAWLDSMIGMFLAGPGSGSSDAAMLAAHQLRALQPRLAAAARRGGDTYTRLHLEDCRVRVARALEARQVLGGSNITIDLGSLLRGLAGDRKPDGQAPPSH